MGSYKRQKSVKFLFSYLASDTNRQNKTNSILRTVLLVSENESPKVFISYSQDSISFADKVLTISNKLRSAGIDAILDQYEESPAEGWPRWMENNINSADFVLVVGSQGYYNKIYGQVEQSKGRGVKREGNIIYQKLYMADTINKKFIPIIFEEKDLEFIPTPLQSSTYYNVSTELGFDRLYWRLRGVTTKEKPPLGKLRPLPEKERKTLFVTSMIDLDTWDKAVWRGAGFILGYTSLPTLILPFVNEKYAIKIFKDWISYIGQNDINDDIRIALVEGEVQGELSGYYVVVGNNIDEAAKRAEKSGIPVVEMLIMNVSRIIRANPTDNYKCFNLFKDAYKDAHEYNLMPAVLDERSGQIKPLPDYIIRKKKLIYRNINDITENDQDAILLHKDKPYRPYKPKQN